MWAWSWPRRLTPNGAGLKAGERLVIAGAAYRVAGIVNTGIRPAKANVYMPIEEARKAAAAHLPDMDLSPYATAVLVEVKNARRQEEAFQSVKSRFPGLVISSYACYQPAERVMGINEDAFRALGAGIAAFILLMVMRSQIAVVMERRREIGMLKAIGWPDKNVVRLLFAETLLQAAAGVAGGCLLAVVTARFLATPAALSGGGLALSAGLPFLGGTVAAILSAWKAARVRPGEALRQTYAIAKHDQVNLKIRRRFRLWKQPCSSAGTSAKPSASEARRFRRSPT